MVQKTPLLHLRSAKKIWQILYLYYPAADALLAIVTDASDTAIGAALHQQVPKRWQPLAFFSKTLSDRENVVANPLSRIHIPTITTPCAIDFKKMAEEQQKRIPNCRTF
ncbi:hypothetical protein NPIL_40351 [Nephila pilipes]|uniref:Reverse transcriptase/retrotransposon-derived protein RNase H-like domain-containing protein n=1 Tax=Nephila pilipes TaxID=299642 RepID=A0A8X6PYU0_NEPPI|nr:hypothetical protein NPIL_40351 [Nephila pilipes]